MFIFTRKIWKTSRTGDVDLPHHQFQRKPFPLVQPKNHPKSLSSSQHARPPKRVFNTKVFWSKSISTNILPQNIQPPMIIATHPQHKTKIPGDAARAWSPGRRSFLGPCLLRKKVPGSLSFANHFFYFSLQNTEKKIKIALFSSKMSKFFPGGKR